MLLAVWLPLIVGEPGLLHPCPMHGALATAIGSARHAPAGVAEHHHASSQQQTSHNRAPGHDHRNCTCVSCCTGSVGAPSTPVTVTTVVVALYEVGRGQRAADLLPSLALDHSRPYPTGPPSA